MQPKKRTRRTREQWLAIIQAWKQTDQSAAQFCAVQDLSYTVFCRWRRRLSRVDEQKHLPEPQFIDLTAPTLHPLPGKSWHIVLNLGDGVSLELTRP